MLPQGGLRRSPDARSGRLSSPAHRPAFFHLPIWSSGIGVAQARVGPKILQIHSPAPIEDIEFGDPYPGSLGRSSAIHYCQNKKHTRYQILVDNPEVLNGYPKSG